MNYPFENDTESICNDLASPPSLMSFFPSVLLTFLSLFVCIHFHNSSICTTFLLYMISVGFSTGKKLYFANEALNSCSI